jgi:hypothetical protein
MSRASRITLNPHDTLAVAFHAQAPPPEETPAGVGLSPKGSEGGT